VVARSVGHSEATRLGETWVKPTNERSARSAIAISPRSRPSGEPILTGRRFTAEEACRIGEQIGIDWGTAPFDVEPSFRGLEVELGHGLREPSTNATDDDPVVTAKIALAHPNESADNYTRLERMEDEAKARARVTDGL
jgi:hypothetical protein